LLSLLDAHGALLVSAANIVSSTLLPIKFQQPIRLLWHLFLQTPQPLYGAVGKCLTNGDTAWASGRCFEGFLYRPEL
jgi:hypothetical protein